MPDPNDTDSTQTDTWNTSQSKADATTLSSLPTAVSDDLDDKDHSAEVAEPDAGGQIFDEGVAVANRG
ncbi:MAG TPA: hypothetical protein VNA57_02060 [Acidimicrobiales bacterium]|nr:hypothetical protein [Acidimicrobiales bacterium]